MARLTTGAGATARLVRADTGTYETQFGSTAAEGVVTLQGANVVSQLFVPASEGRREGGWDAEAGGPGGRLLHFHFEGHDGAPPSLVEVSRGGAAVARIRTRWEAFAGGWRVADRTVMLLRDGAPSGTVSYSFGAPEVRLAQLPASAQSQRPEGREVRPSLDDAIGDCDREQAALDNALIAYDAATLSFSLCLLAAPACLGAVIALFAAAANFDTACARLLRCIGAI